MDQINRYVMNTASTAVILAFIVKKVGKKELLPISGWKQALTTYVFIAGSGYASNLLHDEWNRRNTPAPKPK